MTLPPADALVLAPHPDDAEMSLGGTMLKLVGRGARVVIVDMTRGEMASAGTPELRRAECEAATRLLGVAARDNLERPDAAVRDDDASLAAVVGAIRRHRPRMFFAPLDHDLHPDHAATGAVAGRAYFIAGLGKVLANLGAPHRPEVMFRYPLHHEVEPTVCVDISEVVDRKIHVIECYRSQLPTDRGHLIGLDPLERARARDLYYGSVAGCRAAEPLQSERPLRLSDPMALL